MPKDCDLDVPDATFSGHYLIWEYSNVLSFEVPLFWRQPAHRWSPYDDLVLPYRKGFHLPFPVWMHRLQETRRNLNVVPLLSGLEPLVRGRFRTIPGRPNPDLVANEAAGYGFAAESLPDLLNVYWSPDPSRKPSEWLLCASWTMHYNAEGKQQAKLLWDPAESKIQAALRYSLQLSHPEGYLANKDMLLGIE